MGLEQGYTVPSRPPGAGDALELTSRLSGNLRAHLAKGALILGGRGVTLTYGGVKAVDAHGRPLPAWLTLRKRSLVINVDDSYAAYPISIDPFVQQGKKLVGGASNSEFGRSVSLSGDGTTAVVGGENQSWVFVRDGEGWVEQATLVGSGEVDQRSYGYSVAISEDGDTVLVGGQRSKEPPQGEHDGAAWVFTRSGGAWSQQAELSARGSEFNDFGESVALSGNGDTAFIGDNGSFNGTEAGVTRGVYVFGRADRTWTLEQTIPFHEPQLNADIALSGDGKTAIIAGAEAGDLTFVRSQGTWIQQGAALSGPGSGFPVLSYDGDTALISHGDAPTVFTRSNGVWTEGATLTIGEDENHTIGHLGTLSADGGTILIGVPGDRNGVGMARSLQLSGAEWLLQEPKLTANDEVGAGQFGDRLALSSDGRTAIIGGGQDDYPAGAVWIFVDPLTEPTTPLVSTHDASGIDETSATLNGIVNPNGSEVSDCHFDYGPTSSYGSSVPCSQSAGSGTSPVAVSTKLTGLLTRTTYHYRLVATNSIARAEGHDETFITEPRPTATTSPASEIGHSSATLNAVVNANGLQVDDCQFEYGQSTSYGSSVPCSSIPGGGSQPVALSAAVSGLGGTRIYHFRIVASNEAGSSYGEDERIELARSQQERAEEEATEEEQSQVRSGGETPGTIEVRNPPGTHLEGLTGEEINEAGLPPGSIAVVGGVSYSLRGLPVGTSVDAKFFLPPGSDPTNVFKKIKGEWVDVTYLTTISGNEITFHVRDGGPGDEDGMANGVIVDPMVPVRLSSPPPLPEIGHCQNAPTRREGSGTTYLGDYTDAKCSKSAPGNGKYEWKPGFVKGLFALTGTKSSFETASKTKISCTGISGAGEFTGTNGESVTVTLSGCSTGKAKCQSFGHPEGQIVSSLLGGPIEYTDVAERAVGVDLSPISAAEPDFAEFQCALTQERVTGSVVGQVKTVGKPSAAIEVQFKAKKGVQMLQGFEGGPPDTLSLVSGSTQSEAVGLTTKLKQTGEESLELKN